MKTKKKESKKNMQMSSKEDIKSGKMFKCGGKIKKRK